MSSLNFGIDFPPCNKGSTVCLLNMCVGHKSRETSACHLVCAGGFYNHVKEPPVSHNPIKSNQIDKSDYRKMVTLNIFFADAIKSKTSHESNNVMLRR